MTKIIKNFCEKFNIHRFENNLTIRSFTKSVEEKVNLSKYHLFLSVAENNVDEVKLYNEENSAFLLQRDYNNRSLLHLAASRGHIDMVKLLIDFKKREYIYTPDGIEHYTLSPLALERPLYATVYSLKSKKKAEKKVLGKISIFPHTIKSV